MVAELTTARGIAVATVADAAAGDADALARIVGAHHDDMARICYVICGDQDLAQEAVEAAWPVAWRKLGSLRDPERLRPWLIAFAANEVRRAMRRQRRHQVVEIEVADVGSSHGDPAARPALTDLSIALRRLSPEDRTLLALRHVAGFDATDLSTDNDLRQGDPRMTRSRTSMLPMALMALAVVVLTACSGGSPAATTRPSTSAAAIATTSPSAPSPSARSAASTLSAADAWAEDLDRLDKSVRESHVSPFTIHTETEWKAKLADIGPKLAGANPDQQVVLVASLVGLLDTHSWLTPKGGNHAYEVLFYKFSDGWFTVAAKDKSLIGSRLVSIGGHPVDEVESTLRPLIPHDNEMGFLDGVESLFSYVEYLHGSGIVADPAKPQYVLERPDATRVTVDFPAVDEGTWGDELHILGDLIGDAPEAVARRGELVWTRLDAKDKAFLISVNDYGDMTAAATAMTAALDAGKADRVVLDIRYLRGGSGDSGLVDVIKNDPRVNRTGGLTVLMGRENVSVATLFDYEFDVHTQALLVGEPTPARADNFRCDCQDIQLQHSGIVVTVPTTMSHNGDLRPEIKPDIAMPLSSSDFFAGRDPVLDAALKGLSAP